MSTVQKRIITTLELIQSNKSCNSGQHDFEPEILTDIYEKGLIKAAIHTPVKTGIPQFLDMRLTVDGMKFLEASKTIKDKTNQSSVKWHTNPFLIATLGLITMVSAAGIIYYLGWK